MKKGKFLSVLTSIAMTGSLMLGALPFGASAATNPLGLELTSAKTKYSLDEIAKGATATVYVDPVGTVKASDNVSSVQFKLASSAWGKVDPMDLQFTRKNALGTEYGNDLLSDFPIDQSGTSILSLWKGSAPSNLGYPSLDYKSQGVTAYSDDYLPAAMYMTNSDTGFLESYADGEHLAEFKVYFPTNLAAGKYTIYLQDCKSIICPTKHGGDDSVILASPTMKSITFEIGATGETSSKQTTTTASNSEDGEPVRVYDGSCTISAKKGVKAAQGETIDVPVYMDLGSTTPAYITGVAFKVIYDSSKFELKRFLPATPSGLSSGKISSSKETGTFICSFSDENILVDPTNPIILVRFEVKSTTPNGEYDIKLINHLDGKEAFPIQVVHTQEGQDSTYLRPTVSNGSIIVGEEITTPAGKIYDGTASLKGDKAEGKIGDTVDVPVYLELGSDVDPKYITGIGFKLDYDTNALELSRIMPADPSGLSAGKFSSSKATGTFLYTFSDDNITVDPSNPICILKFNIKDTAVEGETYKIDFLNHLDEFEGQPPQIIHIQDTNTGYTTYLTPQITKGEVKVAKGETISSTQAQTEIVTVTSIVPVESIVTKESIVTVESIVPVESIVAKESIVTVESVVTRESVVTVESVVTRESVVTVESIVPVESVVTRESVVTYMSAIGTVMTSIQPVESIVTSIQPVESIVTSISPVVSYVPEVSVVTSESIVPVESVVTSISPVVSYVPEVSIVTSESVVTRESLVTYMSAVGTVFTSIQPVESIVTSIQPVESIVTSISPVESVVTSISPVESYYYVSSISWMPEVSVIYSDRVVTETVIVTVTVTESTTVSEEPPVVETKISFSIPGSENIEDDDSQWYYADEDSWHLENVKVFINDEEVTDYNVEDLIVTYQGQEKTPASVYDGKTFDYELTISFMGAEDTFKAKIGQRGDANMDHLVNVRDCATIAKDLAQLYNSKKTKLAKFALFLGNVDQGKSTKEPAYAPYEFNVRDAATIAKYLANKPAKPNSTLLDYVSIKK